VEQVPEIAVCFGEPDMINSELPQAKENKLIEKVET